MRKNLLLLLFLTVTAQQIAAQCNLKIATTTPTLCEGQNISMTATGVPGNATLQWKKNGADIDKAVAATYQSNLAGTYEVKTLGKDAIWSKITPKEDFADLIRVFFLNAQTGWTIEDKGGIKKTTDGGITWTKQTSGTTNDLFAIYFLDANKGFISGANDTVLKTIDGGKTWTQIPIPTLPSGFNYSHDYSSVYFLNQDVGWISAFLGVTLKTTDGGSTWKGITTNDFVITIKTAFIDNNTGFIIDFDGNIQKTINSGANWKSKYSRTDQDYFTSIFFQNTKIGWAVGFGSIVNTIDGGETWTEKKGIDLSGNQYLTSVFFTDTKTGYIFNGSGSFNKTIDGGITWTKQSVGLRISVNAVSFIDNNNGWVVGSDGTIIKTDDGGKTWKSLIKGNPISYSSLHFVNSQIGYKVGGLGYIAKTTDGGNNWVEQKSNDGEYISDVQFIDANIGWASASGSSAILKTVDGGVTWEKRDLKPLKYPQAIFFVDDKNGVAVGDKNLIVRTADGGNTWILPKHTWDTNRKYAQLQDVHFVDNQNGWAVGSRVALNTIDRGVTWNEVKMNILNNPNGNNGGVSVFFTDKLNGYILQYSVITNTNDGGKTWIETSLNPNSDEYSESVRFVNSKVGYILGSKGTIWSTMDAGKTWISRPPISSKYMSSLFALDANNVWAVGAGETTLKYEFPTLCNSNQITINPKPAAPTLSWSNAEAKLTAVSASAGTLAWLNGANVINNVTATTYQPTASGSYSVRVTDAKGCAEVSTSLQITILSSEDPLNSSGIRLFPNPSDGLYNVALTRFGNEKEATLNVIGLDGQNLHSQTMKRQNDSLKAEVDVRKLPAGIYFLQVLVGQETTGIKISIAK